MKAEKQGCRLSSSTVPDMHWRKQSEESKPWIPSFHYWFNN